MSPGPLRRLLYISTARRPIDVLTRDDILRTSRRNNAAVGVSGLLVTGHHRFLQALEGAPDAVAATFARIERDPRHFAVVILGNTLVTERSFGTWAMGDQDTATASGSDNLEALVSRLADPTLRAYFEGFMRAQARAA